MTSRIDRTIELFVAGDVFQKLRLADQQIAREAACIKGFDEQLEQLRICNQQLEKRTAQPIRFDESNKLIEGGLWTSGFSELTEQKWPQLAKNLSGPR